MVTLVQRQLNDTVWHDELAHGQPPPFPPSQPPSQKSRKLASTFFIRVSTEDDSVKERIPKEAGAKYHWEFDVEGALLPTEDAPRHLSEIEKAVGKGRGRKGS